MRKTLALFLVLVMSLSLAALSASAANVTVIKVGHVGAPVSPQSGIVDMWAKLVAEKTGGSVEIKQYGSSTLGSEQQIQELVKSGTVDAGVVGTWSRLAPWAGIYETPFIWNDMNHFVKYWSGKSGKKAMVDLEREAGVKMIFVAPHGSFRRLTNNVRPIKTPEDMKGLKLRDPNVPAYSIVAKALGATPTPIDFAELYVALDRKVVDGQHNPLSHVVGSKFYEVQKYLSMVPYAIVPHIVGISMNTWNRLTPAQQKAVIAAGLEVQKNYPAVALTEEQEYVKQLSDKMTITYEKDIDLKAFKKIFKEKALPELHKQYGDKAYQVLLDVLNAGK